MLKPKCSGFLSRVRRNKYAVFLVFICSFGSLMLVFHELLIERRVYRDENETGAPQDKWTVQRIQIDLKKLEIPRENMANMKNRNEMSTAYGQEDTESPMNKQRKDEIENNGVDKIIEKSQTQQASEIPKQSRNNIAKVVNKFTEWEIDKRSHKLENFKSSKLKNTKAVLEIRTDHTSKILFKATKMPTQRAQNLISNKSVITNENNNIKTGKTEYYISIQQNSKSKDVFRNTFTKIVRKKRPKEVISTLSTRNVASIARLSSNANIGGTKGTLKNTLRNIDQIRNKEFSNIIAGRGEKQITSTISTKKAGYKFTSKGIKRMEKKAINKLQNTKATKIVGNKRTTFKTERIMTNSQKANLVNTDRTDTRRCEVTEKISRRSELPNVLDGPLMCKPHKASISDCLYAKSVYQIDKRLHKCTDSNTQIFCNGRLEQGTLRFTCNNRNNCSYFTIYKHSNKSGEIVSAGSFRSIELLENRISEIAEKSIIERSYFLFVKCMNATRNTVGNQLIILPTVPAAERKLHAKNEKLQIKSNVAPVKTNKSPNINIILLDSISRAHFYRSLPVVIEKFNEINTNRSSNVEIIDFELFQSVHGHSAENYHALFTGTLFPKSMSDHEKERHKIGADVLYKKFKMAGYETQYQDDLCWESWWGMRMELGSPSDWDSLVKNINESFIDDTGVSLSSCEVLNENNLKTPFNGPKTNQICYNGRFQHSYILDYLHQYHKETSLYQTKPRFSFTTINTAHDYTGLRVQTLNHDLEKFVQDMSELPDTLTILLADHGNTYTSYTNAVMEGRYEMFHPSFFMLIPGKVAEMLGNEAMNALRLNSNRLFTMLDLHASLASIADNAHVQGKPKEYRGILQKIAANRTCDDLNLRLPNLCVCEGWDTEVRNDSTQIGILEFAVGTMNNMILDQQESQAKITAKCQRLYPLYFMNVRERNAGENLITTLDFRVQAGDGAEQNEDIFHAEIQSTVDPYRESRRMKLLSFDRLSQYGIYRVCKDDNVDVRLCVCTLEISQDETNESTAFGTTLDIRKVVMLQPRYQYIPGLLTIEHPDEENCTFAIERVYSAVDSHGKVEPKNLMAVSLEVINICPNTRYEVYAGMKIDNMKTSVKMPLTRMVRGHSIRFLVTAMKYVPYWDSSATIALARRTKR